MVRVKEHMQPRHQNHIRTARHDQWKGPVCTRSQSPAGGPSASVHSPPLTTPRSNLSTHIPLKLQHTYPPFPAIYMICTLMGWAETMLMEWKFSFSLFAAGQRSNRKLCRQAWRVRGTIRHRSKTFIRCYCSICTVIRRQRCCNSWGLIHRIHLL